MTTFKKAVPMAVAAILIAGLGGSVFAQGSATDAIAARQAFMKSIGDNLKAVQAANTATPAGMAEAKVAAQKLADGFKALPGQFPAGSDKSVGKTRARPEIWSDAAYFKAETDKAITASEALVTATSGSDPVAVTNATIAVSGLCKSCHGSYRAQAYL